MPRNSGSTVTTSEAGYGDIRQSLARWQVSGMPGQSWRPPGIISRRSRRGSKLLWDHFPGHLLVDGERSGDGTTPRTYSYVDNLYFLKQGDGPWGPRSWTYDRIGNRLSETRGTTTDTYSYTNHNPRLTSIAMGGGAGTKDFVYDSVGNEIRLASPLSLLYQRYDGVNRLVYFKDDATGAATYMTYDGRNFLTQARQDIATCCSPVLTQAVYSSEGVLHGRSVKNVLGGALSKETKVFYFAGRPVGLLEMTTTPATLSHLITDHLGTPVVKTNAAGTSVWGGGFEPFGNDWNGAQTSGELLRFPGQWEDGAWAGSGLYYNVNRWYDSRSGQYKQPDPLGGGAFPYLYVAQHPTVLIDPLGLCCDMPQAQSIALFDRPSVAGTVICCDGKATPCLNSRNEDVVQARRGFDPIVDQIFLDCATEHEQRHADFHVTCSPECGIKPSVLKPDFPLDFAECDAWSKHGICLWRKRAACGGDIECQARTYALIRRLRPQPARYGCPGLF